MHIGDTLVTQEEHGLPERLFDVINHSKVIKSMSQSFIGWVVRHVDGIIT